MKQFTIKVEIFFIIFFIILLAFFTVVRIKRNYHMSPLATINKDLILVRTSIDDFYEKYNRYPNEEEIQGFDEEGLFFDILSHNLQRRFHLLSKFEFPETPTYLKKVDDIFIEIPESNNIKICHKLENLGVDNKEYTSNGGWIYCPLNGEFRANLQNSSARNKLTHDSRPKWGNDIDWYYK